MGFDKSLMPTVSDMGRKSRRFICMRCEKACNDYRAGYKKTFEDGVKLETENIDLCNKCYKKTESEYRQTEFIKDKLGKGDIKEEDLKRISEDPNFKRELYEGKDGIVNKKGKAKAFKENLIKERLKAQKEGKKDV